MIKVRRNENISVTMAGGVRNKRLSIEGTSNPYMTIKEAKKEDELSIIHDVSVTDMLNPLVHKTEMQV